MDRDKLEETIKDKGLNAPRLSPDKIKAKVKDVYFHVVPGTTLTICVITLENGFMVTGESAAASMENFDSEVGRSVAYGKALEKIWMLEGYLLKEKLYQETK